ncbi:hypothetical protein TNCV_2537091 [Trichonephila clavipes]|nr:hypothetical protein TNCV_2537091 [Trichonephila clavipes]
MMERGSPMQPPPKEGGSERTSLFFFFLLTSPCICFEVFVGSGFGEAGATEGRAEIGLFHDFCSSEDHPLASSSSVCSTVTSPAALGLCVMSRRFMQWTGKNAKLVWFNLHRLPFGSNGMALSPTVSRCSSFLPNNPPVSPRRDIGIRSS